MSWFRRAPRPPARAVVDRAALRRIIATFNGAVWLDAFEGEPAGLAIIQPDDRIRFIPACFCATRGGNA